MVERLDGFLSFAPGYRREGLGFHPNYFENLARIEASSFWFIVRNELILWSLKKYTPGFSKFMEIGCGTAFVMDAIEKAFPTRQLFGSEIFTEGLKIASQRCPRTSFFQMDACHIPFAEEFDVIGAFDVLEHIQDDRRVLSQISRALKRRGTLILTVPQHSWLWSPADEYARHERRYHASDLHEKLNASGFKIQRSTSFVSTLLPAMLLSRVQQRWTSTPFDPIREFRIHPLLNTLFKLALQMEFSGIRKGFDYPWGGSRLVIATKT